MAGNSWRIDRFDGLEGLLALEADWRRLVDQMPERAWHHSFESHVWFLQHSAMPGRAFTCLALRAGSELQAICPLTLRPKAVLGIKRWVWQLPWDGNVLFRDVICPPGEARQVLISQMVNHLVRERQPAPWLVLGRTPAGSAVWSCLESLPRRQYVADLDAVANFLDASLPLEEHAARRSKNFRGNLRKARNKLAQLPSVRFDTVQDSVGLARELEVLLDLEAAGWKGSEPGGSAIRLRSSEVAYYRKLVREMEGVEINTLSTNGRCIAAQLCVRAGSEYAMLKICYDEEYARVAPGQMLFEHTLERCVRDAGVRRINLMTNYDWHRDWGAEGIPIYDIYLPLRPWLAPLRLALLRTRWRLGEGLRRLRRVQEPDGARS
jgi:hypothetical protein